MSPYAWEGLISETLGKVWPELPDGLRWIRAQVQAESAGDAEARSPAGAVGLLQLMPITAREMGLIVSAELDERLVPERNLTAGVGYLRKQYEHLPEVPDHLNRLLWSFAAYNCGRGFVNVALALMRREDAIRHISKASFSWNVGREELAEPECSVGGVRPDYKQVWDYVARIQRGFADL